MNKLLTQNKNRVDLLLFILLVAQPILDVISFFMVESQMTAVTTVLRMAIFVGITLFCFCISDNKKPYYIMAAVLAVYWTLHMVGCFTEGYQSVVQDASQFLRTIQMPILTICFIDVFKKGNKIPDIIQKAFMCNYLTITGVIILSYIVNKPVNTYYQVGIKGWFAVGNAQSCIISLLAPLSIYYAIKSKNKIKIVLITLVAFANMFCFGTRAAYYFIFLTIIALAFFMIINKRKDYFIYGLLAVCFVSSLLLYKVSPCYINRFATSQSMQEWQEQINNVGVNKDDPNKVETEEEKRQRYLEIYNLYSKPLVERFGLDRVMEKYDYSLSADDLINNRELKINFSSLVMDEKNLMVHLFGFEYMDYYEGEECYDLENDFPAIYFSYGVIGLAMYIVFLAYFVFLILRKLLTDFKNSITIENGMAVTTFIMIISAAQLSGNVLRKPNVSIYLSLILAYVYYLCVIKKKDEKNG